MENINLKKYKLLLIGIVLILSSFVYGIYIGKTQYAISNSEIFNIKNATSSVTSVDLEPLWTVWKILNEKFVYTHKDAKEINDQDKVWGIIQGLTSSYGDPYTVFLPPVESKNFESEISGNFEGVGMELGIKDKSIVVVSPLKGSPAEKAGIKKGDTILNIDDKSTFNMSIDEAVKLIRGKAGTTVVIKIARDGVAEPIEISIVRNVIDIPTIDTEIKGDVFIIRLYNFYAISPAKFRGALRELLDSGKTKLILDVRGNPGGYLDAAVDMASFFLPLGKVIVSEDFGPKFEPQVYRSRGYATFNNLKMIILVDGGSASASEILAGALQEHGIAKLVGTKTFGKGSVQELIEIPPNMSLKVTLARWLTPKGVSISDGGLTPDYEVKITDADLKAGKDVQLEKALEILK